MRKKLALIAIVAVIALSSFAYAWVGKDDGNSIQGTEGAFPSVTRFEVIVNGIRSLDVCVCVNISDGVTYQEAELIAGTTFIHVKGESVWRRLETLTFDDTQIKAHYAWGLDEADLGHIYDMTADLTSLQILVDHCF
ncbi:MAG: hypothetical protein JSV35_02820 [Candidatus Bathyarchaeota archaeon]|nr:MAG: hypothetical protein JSV35_02820 [Candidatus Bathyarchaeota archaeon]